MAATRWPPDENQGMDGVTRGICCGQLALLLQILLHAAVVHAGHGSSGGDGENFSILRKFHGGRFDGHTTDFASPLDCGRIDFLQGDGVEQR